MAPIPAPCRPRDLAFRSPLSLAAWFPAALFLAACGGGGGGGGSPPDPNPPQLRFVSFQTDQTVVQAGRTSVVWVGDDADDDATVSIFADADGNLGTTADRHTLVDEVVEADGIEQQAPVDLGEVPGGTYAVLGRIRDGKGGEKVVAAPGRLVVEDRALVAPIGGNAVEIVDHLPRPDGSFDVLGRFQGVVVFDPRHRISSTSRTWDLFVAHHSPRGVIRWLRPFASTGDMRASAFVRDADGSLLIAGSFGGTLTLPDQTTVRGSNADVFVARVTAAGEPLWVRTASSLNADLATDLDLLADGSFVVAGTFNIGNTTYGIEFGNDRNGQPVALGSAGGADAFVARYESDGTPLWAAAVGGAATEQGLATVVLPGDRILVGGSFEATASFGDGSVQHTALGEADGFLAEWAPSGALLRVDLFTGSGAEQVVDLCGCADGDLAVLANSTSAVLDIAGQSTLQLATGGDATLSRFEPSGRLRWALGAAVGPGPDTGAGIVPRADGSLLVAGTYAEGAQFGPGGPTLAAGGGTDGFVSSLAADGSLQWLRRFGSAGPETGMALSTGPDGTLLVTGDRGSADLEVHTGRGTVTLPVTGSSSDFIARFNPDGELGRAPDLSRRVAGQATISRGRIEIRVDGLAAVLDGFDDVENSAAIRQLIEEQPMVGLLVVQRSNGPDRGSAHLEAALAIAAAGLETHLPFNGSIIGGGIDLFLGGRRRTVEPGGAVGVRSWRDESRFAGYDVRDDRSHPAHRPYLDFYAALGVPPDYYWTSIQTPRSTHRELSAAEIAQYGVVTD